MNAPVLRRTKKDWWAVGAISAVSAVALLGAYFTSDIRAATLTPDNPPGSDAAAAPLSQVSESLVHDAEFPAPPGENPRPVVDGLVISAEGATLTAFYPTGEAAWHYTRDDADLCSLGTAWGKVVATYRTGVGCGDVVAIEAATGKHSATRSALNADAVGPISSNDRVGTVAPERVELWRSDMVRTIEYGEVEAVQEPDQQPHPECTITSALTRTSLLALTETCPSGPDGTETTDWLRLMDTTPEDAREPEVSGDFELPTGSRLVSIGQESASVYAPGTDDHAAGEFIAVYKNGTETGRDKAPSAAEAPALADATPDPHPVFTPATADLPHHMSWFDGTRLHLFNPSDQRHVRAIDNAVGTGVAVDGRLLVPTAAGIAVLDWETGETLRDIPVDRGGYAGPISLNVAGDHVIEKRGTQLVSLRTA